MCSRSEAYNNPSYNPTQYRNQFGRAATHSISTFAFRGRAATPTHVLAGGTSFPKNYIVVRSAKVKQKIDIDYPIPPNKPRS